MKNIKNLNLKKILILLLAPVLLAQTSNILSPNYDEDQEENIKKMEETLRRLEARKKQEKIDAYVEETERKLDAKRKAKIEAFVTSGEEKIDAGLKENRERFIEAIKNGDLKTVKFLLYNAKVDPEIIDEKSKKSAREIAEDTLLKKNNTLNRQLILHEIKENISRKNLQYNPKFAEGFEIVKRGEERPYLVLKIKDLNVYVQRFLEKKIKEEILKKRLENLRLYIVNNLENISQENEVFEKALAQAKEYSKEYQDKIKKSMSTMQWAQWLAYGDPVSNFWQEVIKTLESYIREK